MLRWMVAFLLMTSLAAAAENKVPKEKWAATDAEHADADFPLQGEYAGVLKLDGSEIPYGAQVIALGDGKFRCVAYPGGLPGEGWNHDERLVSESELKDGDVRFIGDRIVAILTDGSIKVEDRMQNALGTWKKVDRKSSTLGLKPPEGAVVLFDGSNTDHFPNGKMTKDGLLIQGITSRGKFQNFSLHLEFQLSYMPYAREQGRSNSGCYQQGRYEVQILDSFGLDGLHNECGGIYSIKAPDVNMCLPPLAWQTYDIDFTAAKFNDKNEKTANAKISVMHNGVAIHKDVELDHATTAAPVKEGPEPGPIYLQDHNNPVRFRNIWVLNRGE